MTKQKKVVVIGGSGLIGAKTVALLRAAGHDARAASPRSGVDAVTGAGLAEALAGAEVVIDVANAPSWEPAAVLSFFETSTRNLLAAGAAAGVGHHVALSVVGVERMPDNGYFRAKRAQEALIEGSGRPFTIVRATQFFEFLGAIADAGEMHGAVRLAGGLFQPIAADDVAEAVAEIATAAPLSGVLEIAGPERAPLDEIIARHLHLAGDPRPVRRDPDALYFGGRIGETSLVPGAAFRMGRLRHADWLGRGAAH